MKNMKINVVRYIRNDSLLVAILFLILGVILFTTPGSLIRGISYLMGVIFVLIGLFNFRTFKQYKDNLKIIEYKLLLNGIVMVTIGLVFFFASSAIEFTIRLIMGGFIIYRGVIKLISAINIKTSKQNYSTPLLVISIIMIMLGLYIIIVSNLVISLLGLFIMIFAITEIINIIFNMIGKKNDKYYNDKIIEYRDQIEENKK